MLEHVAEGSLRLFLLISPFKIKLNILPLLSFFTPLSLTRFALFLFPQLQNPSDFGETNAAAN